MTRLDRSTLENITAAELHNVWKQHGSGLTAEQLRHTGAVKLGDIYTAPKVFQPRNVSEYPHEVDAHVRKLADKVTRRGDKLDRIPVFAVAGFRLAVDGHCRLWAYEKAGLPSSATVPVKHVTGSFEDALILSVSDNRKDKLRLTGNMKSEAAWRLVKWNERAQAWTQEHIAKHTDRSLRLIKKMTHTLKNKTLGFDPRVESSWKAVLGRIGGAHDAEVWTDEEVEELIQTWASGFRKVAKPRGDRMPEVVLAALLRAFPRTAQAIADDAEQAES